MFLLPLCCDVVPMVLRLAMTCHVSFSHLEIPCKTEITISHYLVKVMGWRLACDKPLPEPVMTQFTDTYTYMCITGCQWVSSLASYRSKYNLYASFSNTFNQRILNTKSLNLKRRRQNIGNCVQINNLNVLFQLDLSNCGSNDNFITVYVYVCAWMYIHYIYIF